MSSDEGTVELRSVATKKSVPDAISKQQRLPKFAGVAFAAPAKPILGNAGS
jgi:hypothetical protein